MSRLLLFVAIAGLGVALWSFLASATIRPTPFGLLTSDLDAAATTYHFSPEERQLLSARVAELQRAHAGEVRRYADAFAISFFGLLAFSLFCLVASFFSRSRRCG